MLITVKTSMQRSIAQLWRLLMLMRKFGRQAMKAELLEALKKIRERPMPRFGICHQLAPHLSDENPGYWRSELRGLFRRWPQFSGDADFPVPHHTEPACIAYIAYSSTQNMWDRRTKYGQARWSLLEFCISELEKELSDE